MVYSKIQVDVQIDCRENMSHTLQAFTGYEERVLRMISKSRLRQSTDGIHEGTMWTKNNLQEKQNRGENQDKTYHALG